MRANIAVYATKSGIELELTDARSGSARGRGHLLYFRGSAPRAAVMLSTTGLRVGLILNDTTLRVTPFVAEQWLSDTWRTMASVKSVSKRN
ncbi:MAG: hypothetical protein QM784_19645 [Polyangiaceae bacterium]